MAVFLFLKHDRSTWVSLVPQPLVWYSTSFLIFAAESASSLHGMTAAPGDPTLVWNSPITPVVSRESVIHKGFLKRWSEMGPVSAEKSVKLFKQANLVGLLPSLPLLGQAMCPVREQGKIGGGGDHHPKTPLPRRPRYERDPYRDRSGFLW